VILGFFIRSSGSFYTYSL